MKGEPPPATAKRKGEPGLFRLFVLFFVYMGVGALVLDVGVVKRALVDPWTRFNVTAASTLATWVGVDTVADGTMARSGPAMLDILDGCNGVHALLILVASILSFPSTWTRRLVGVAAGAVTIFGFNIVRIVNLIVVARHFPEQLELFHIFIWQTLIVLVAFASFLVWGSRFASARPEKHAA